MKLPKRNASEAFFISATFKNGTMVDSTAADAKNKDASCLKHLCKVQIESV